MKHKTSELSGALLDAAVAKALGMAYEIDLRKLLGYSESMTHFTDVPACKTEYGYFEPSTSWEQGGPIIERERIAIVCSRPRFDTNDGRRWDAYFDGRYTGPDGQVDCNGDISEGATPLVAAMRSFVTAKLGAETDL